MGIAGVYNGSAIWLYLDSEIVVHSTSTSFQVEQKLKDTTCRETEGWDTNMVGQREWGMSVEGAVAFRTKGGTLYSSEPNYVNVTEIINKYILNRNSVYLELVPPGASADNLKFSGWAFVNSVSVDTPMEDTSTFSIALSGINQLLKTITGPTS